MLRPAEKKIRVGIFVESRLLADSLLYVLQEESDLTCAGINGFSFAYMNHPEVILLDWQDATETNLKEATTNLPNIKLVVTNGDAAGLDLVLCSRFAVMGFTLKAATSADIVKTVRAVASGVTIIPQCIGARLYKEVHEVQNRGHHALSFDALTVRERDVANLASAGLRNKEIAAKLSLETDTVKTHMRSVLRKLGMRDRLELVKLSASQNPGWCGAVAGSPFPIN